MAGCSCSSSISISTMIFQISIADSAKSHRAVGKRREENERRRKVLDSCIGKVAELEKSRVTGWYGGTYEHVDLG